MSESLNQLPLVLIASDGEWVGRSLGNVLELNGYMVLRADSGRRALELARRTSPEAVLLDDSLPDISGVEVCRALRDDPLFSPATPVAIFAEADEASRVRAAAYASGAWEYCTLPVDTETLLAKLGTFIRASREIDNTRTKALVDRLTGLYSEYGLQQWLEQMSARATRKSEPMACVVVAPNLVGEGLTLTAEQSSDVLAEVTNVCRAKSRKSDVVGYLGDQRVAILAPDTDQAGVVRLIERLQEALGETASKARGGRHAASLRAGYCAVPNLAAANMAPSEIVRRAEQALSRAHRHSGAISFDDALLS